MEDMTRFFSTRRSAVNELIRAFLSWRYGAKEANGKVKGALVGAPLSFGY